MAKIYDQDGWVNWDYIMTQPGFCRGRARNR